MTKEMEPKQKLLNYRLKINCYIVIIKLQIQNKL